MKTEEKLIAFETFEPNAPDSQPVTWGNRVVTVLMIAAVWLIPVSISALCGTGWEQCIAGTTSWFSSIPCSLGLLIALFAWTKNNLFWSRCFALLTVPLPAATLVGIYYPAQMTTFDKFLSNVPELRNFISRYLFDRNPYLDTMPINSNYLQVVVLSIAFIFICHIAYRVIQIRKAAPRG